MKQFQFEYINTNNFRRELSRIKRFCDKTTGARPVFQIFTQVAEFDGLKDMIRIIEEDFPDSFYYGCQSFGNIIDGNLARDKTLVVCSVWEYESTKVEAVYIDPTNENSKFRTLDDLWEYSNSLGWVKAIEIISTYQASEILRFGEDKVNLPPEVKIFGAIAINPLDITSSDSFLFSKTDGVSNKTAMAFFLGGEDLSVDCFACTGWEGLGKSFRITNCEGKIVHEIDNEPASEIYKKYLGISYGEDFIRKSLRFPLLVETNGMECIRIPMPAEHEDDIELTVAPKQGARVRIAFGATSKILEAINANVKKIYDFAPETIRIYSCATRRQFWGDDKVSLETSMLDGIAATVGFYTRGELMRMGDYLQYFNATIVTCLVREGNAVQSDYQLDELIETRSVYQETSKALLQYLEEITQEIESHHNRTMAGIARTYSAMFEIDLIENTLIALNQNSNMDLALENIMPAFESMNQLVKANIIPEYKNLANTFFDLSTLDKRLKNKSFIDVQFIGKKDGWFRAQFIAISYTEEGNLEKVILTLQSIDCPTAHCGRC